MQRPALTKVRTSSSATLQTLGVLEVTLTVKPGAFVVAVRVYGNWVLFSEVGGAKVMVCESLLKLIDLEIAGAAA